MLRPLFSAVIYLLWIQVLLLSNSGSNKHIRTVAVATLSEIEVNSIGTVSSAETDLTTSEIEAGSIGDSEEGDEEISAIFRNDFHDRIVYLFWQHPDDGSSVFMSDLAPGGEGRLNTFVGHQFFVSSDRAGNIRLEQVVVTNNRLEYAFGRRRRSDSNNPLTTNDISPSPHVKLLNSPTTACSAKFRSLVPTPVSIWFEDKRGGLYQGALDLGKEYTINTYAGHVFFFTAKDDKSKEYARFRMKQDQVLYVVTDPENIAPSSFLEHQQREEAFMAEYLNATGRQWRHYFGPDGPRGPPTQYMWPAEHVGQVLAANSTEAHWLCEGHEEQCRSEPLNLELEVISLEPRAYIIKNFLSDFEADEIMRIADPRMARSTVGNKDGGGTRSSDTRTSRNAWVGRSVNYATEALYARAEQLLKIPRLDGRNTEDMQVVHYVRGQKYDSHHDWGVSGYVESRYITLLMYLTDMVSPTAGGETSFPKAAGGRGIKVHPGKGSAVLFYNLLEDGNGDDLALHAALPVNVGEKWLANFWVWDPKRK